MTSHARCFRATRTGCSSRHNGDCMHRILGVLSLCLAISLAVAADQPVPEFPRVPATPPEKALDTFRALAGFRMELLAAEPLVTDPVAMAYDEDGRAFVAEMSDYPYTDAATHQAWKANTTDEPIGRLRPLDPLCGEPLLADGPRVLERRDLRRGDAGRVVPEGHRRRRQGRHPAEGLHRISEVQRPGGDEQPCLGARQLHLRSRRQQRRTRRAG